MTLTSFVWDIAKKIKDMFWISRMEGCDMTSKF